MEDWEKVIKKVYFRGEEVMDRDSYYFFLKGPLSQWVLSPFSLGDISYRCGEQYMMYQKAKLFGDSGAMEKIIREISPAKQKEYGRGVKGFDQSTWDKYKYQIVLNGNLAKFAQNIKHLTILIETGDKILVEANPRDRVWGIGKGIDDPNLMKVEEWGENLLGKVLMEVRSTLSRMLLNEKLDEIRG